METLLAYRNGSPLDWCLLAQFESDEASKMVWGDGGRVYFWIRKVDLAARRFDKVVLQAQCG